MILQSDLLKQYVRQFPAPVDATTLFSTKAAAEYYAATNPTAYAGQIIVCPVYDEYRIFIVQQDKSLTDIADDGKVANPIVFTVAAGATVETDVFDADKHKAMTIEYLVATIPASTNLQMGTLRISENIFFEINVTGDIGVKFSRDNGKILVANSSVTDVEIQFIYNSFNK